MSYMTVTVCYGRSLNVLRLKNSQFGMKKLKVPNTKSVVDLVDATKRLKTYIIFQENRSKKHSI